jgi:hypothetical protein
MVKLDEILAIRKTLVMSFLPKFRILEKNSPSSDIFPVKEKLLNSTFSLCATLKNEPRGFRL